MNYLGYLTKYWGVVFLFLNLLLFTIFAAFGSRQPDIYVVVAAVLNLVIVIVATASWESYRRRHRDGSRYYG